MTSVKGKKKRGVFVFGSAGGDEGSAGGDRIQKWNAAQEASGGGGGERWLGDGGGEVRGGYAVLVGP